MAVAYKFEKILTIREKEKEEKQSQYEQAMHEFEGYAKKLYTLLKQKEELESSRQQQLVQGLSVHKMIEHQHFIGDLEKIIMRYQHFVITSRKKMHRVQEELIGSTIEVKKYEKMKQRNDEQYLFQEKQAESIVLDEISIQQFMNREM